MTAKSLFELIRCLQSTACVATDRVASTKVFVFFVAADHRGHERNAYDDRVRAEIVATPERRNRALRSINWFRLILLRQSYAIGLVQNVGTTNPDVIIVRVRSTVCNDGPVLRGCMIMQSTTCQSPVRSDSLSPINRLRHYRPSFLDERVCVCRG